MKKILSLFAFAAMIMVTQSCGSKKEENSETTVTETTTPAKPTLEERRARVKRERDEYSERRRLAAEERAKANASYTDSKGKTVYYIVDVKPTFRGSEEQLESYIQENIAYPDEAKNQEIEGTVFVDFVVGADGTVRDVEVSEATSEQVSVNLGGEATRVVTNMPQWTPGTKGGKAVDVKVSLPITFQLDM